MARIIAIANQKGGVGKTTSTIEIASCIADRGYKVLVVDMDMQCNTTKISGCDLTKKTLFNALNVELHPKDIIQKSENGYDIMPGSPALSKADKKFSEPTDVYLLQDALSTVSKSYDFIVIDNGPARNTLLNMVYVAADEMIMCVDSDEDSVDGVIAIVKDMAGYIKSRRKLTHCKITGFIQYRYEKTIMHSNIEQMLEYVLENIVDKKLLPKKKPFIMKVRKSIVASEAKSERKSMQRYKHYSNPAIDYRKITDVILENGGK